MEITKRVNFSAAHSIAGAGKCANKHGHNWVAIIKVNCDTLDSTGFIVDVAKLKKTAFQYDHDDLDNYFEQPTTEIVCQKIANDALEVVLANQPLAKCTVHVHLIETENNSADAIASNVIGTLNEGTFREVGLKGAKNNE